MLKQYLHARDEIRNLCNSCSYDVRGESQTGATPHEWKRWRELYFCQRYQAIRVSYTSLEETDAERRFSGPCGGEQANEPRGRNNRGEKSRVKEWKKINRRWKEWHDHYSERRAHGVTTFFKHSTCVSSHTHVFSTYIGNFPRLGNLPSLYYIVLSFLSPFFRLHKLFISYEPFPRKGEKLFHDYY